MEQPSFIYANYPVGATVTGQQLAAGQTAADVLQPDEDTFVSPAVNYLTLTFDMLAPYAVGCFAVAGEMLDGVNMELRGSSDNFVSSNNVISVGSAVIGDVAVWRAFNLIAYRYYRLTVTATSATRLYHVALAPLYLFPWMDDGADLDKFQTESTFLISPRGHFLGAQKNKTELKLSLNWGQVTEAEYVLFEAWAISCVQTPRPFFFIPDTGSTVCRFGYTDPKYAFSAPMKNGLRNLATIPFTARMT